MTLAGYLLIGAIVVGALVLVLGLGWIGGSASALTLLALLGLAIGLVAAAMLPR